MPHNSILNEANFLSNIKNLKDQIQGGLDLNQLYNGLTLLDIALIHDQQAAVSILQNCMGNSQLTTDQVFEQRQLLLRQSELVNRYHIKVVHNRNGAYSIQVSEYPESEERLINQVEFSHEDLNQIGRMQGNIGIISLEEHPYLAIFDKQDSTLPIAVLRMTTTGELEIKRVNSRTTKISIDCDAPISVHGDISIKELQISATGFLTSERAKIQANISSLVITGKSSLKGSIISDTLSIDSQSIENNGHIIVLREYGIKSEGRFDQKGILIGGQKGDIHVHAFENHPQSITQVSDGALKIFGHAFIKNSGSIISDHLVLDSAYLINNHYAALIKAVTYIIPPITNQFNNAGFLLVGRKTNLTAFDKALNLASAATEIASIFSMGGQPLQNLKTTLMLGKTLYTGAKILSKLYENETSDISSELVHLFLDHVIPSLGNISGNEQKTKFICNVLYQFWGWYLGEDVFIDKSLNLIEMIVRGSATLAGGYLKPEDVAILENVARTIQFSKHALKYAGTAAEVMNALLSEDRQVWDNAKDTVSALSESILRDLLQNLKPEKIFDIEFNPRDLALFVLNKGFEQTYEAGIKRAVFALIYALHKSDKLSDELKADYQFYAQTFFSGPVWIKLFKNYESGKLTYLELVQQAFNQITVYASHKVTKDQFNKKEVSEPEETTPLENKVEEGVATESSPKEGSQEPGLQETVSIQHVPTENDVITKVAENSEKVLVTYDQEYTNLAIDLEAVVDAGLAANAQQSTQVASQALGFEYVQAMLEVQRALDGDYATQGYLGAFSNILHNDGILDTIGTSQFLFTSGTNSNLVRATKDIQLSGYDVNNRDDEGKVVNRDTTNTTSISQFVNHEDGTLKANGEIHSNGIGAFNNHGAIQAASLIQVQGGKEFTNYENGAVATQNGDSFIQADKRSTNFGRMSGKNVVLEGTTELASNPGNIFAHDNIRMVSEQEANLNSSGRLVAKKIFLEAEEIKKTGSVQAAFCKTLGYDSLNPNSVAWGASSDDSVYGLALNPTGNFTHDPDAFNKAKITDLQLNHEQIGSLSELNIDPNFNNTLQIQLPGSSRTFSARDLPLLSPEATLVLIAPGSTLEAIQPPSEPFEYKSALHFSGQSFHHSGQNTFRNSAFDTQVFKGDGAYDSLILKDGGLVQSKEFTNPGYLHSDGRIHWNVDTFTNDAQLRQYIEQFTHSKQTGVIETHIATAVIDKSGTVHAQGHTGYIGELNQMGGSLTSDEKGNFLYIHDANLRPIFSQSGQYTRGVVEDVGMSWHILPVSHNSEIGSTGENVLLGTGNLTGTGVDVWGDKANHVYFNKGIDIDSGEAQTYVVQEAKDHSNGKTKYVTVPYSVNQVISKNSISANQGLLTLGAAKGSIHLANTVVSSSGDASFIAEDAITINGVEVKRSESYQHRAKGLLHSKKVSSETEITEIQSSYLYVGGTLVVSCLDFQLCAAQSVVSGDVDITAVSTTLSGKEEHFTNTTTTKEFSVGLPTDNLQSILSGHNAKAIFSTLIQNCGWEPEELKALLNAKSVAELPGPLLNMARNTWNLTALVARAFNEYTDGTPASFVGTITDQLGLTTGKGSMINPKVRLNWSTTKEHTEKNAMIASNLYVGGTFKLFGSKLVISDGSKIDAKDLLISLAKGIEMTKGMNTFTYSAKSKNYGVGVNVRDPIGFDLNAANNTASMKSETATLASIQGRESAHIHVGSGIHGEGRITAPTGEIIAPEIALFSVQSTFKQSDSSKSFAVNSTFTHFSGHNGSSTIDKLTTEKSEIFMPNGTVETNAVHLEKGAIIHAKQFVRTEGEEGLPTVTGTNAYDHDYQSSSSMGLQLSAFEPGLQIKHLKEIQESVHLTSVYAENVTHGDLPGINSTKELETQVTRSSRKAFSVAAIVPDIEKYKEQLKDIEQASSNLGQYTSDALKKGGAPLLFMFNKETRPSGEGVKVSSTEPLVALPADEEPILPAFYADGRSEAPPGMSSNGMGQAGQCDSYSYENGRLNLCINVPVKKVPDDSDKPEHASMPSSLPDLDDNPLLDHLRAAGRGLENAIDQAVDTIVHPIDTGIGIATSVWDGYNALADLTLGISTEGARERNRARGEGFHEIVEIYEEGGTAATEMSAEIIASMVIGGAMGGAARMAVTAGMKKAGLAVLTPQGYAFQAFTPRSIIKLIKVRSGAPVRRIGNIDKSRPAAEAQYWGVEPLSTKTAIRYGIPEQNVVTVNFGQEGILKPGARAITRPAPGVGRNPGDAIEVVVEPGGIELTNPNLMLPQYLETGNRSKMAQIIDKSIQTLASEPALGALIMEERQLVSGDNARNQFRR